VSFSIILQNIYSGGGKAKRKRESERMREMIKCANTGWDNDKPGSNSVE